MATLSITYEELRVIAARALGLDRTALRAEQESQINEIPNLAVAELLRMRSWPHLKKQLVLTPTIDAPWSLLPADFDQFWCEQELTYGPDSGYCRIGWTDAAWIQRQRAVGSVADVPVRAALGDTLDEVTTATASADGSGSFSGTYSYRWRHVSSDGAVVTVSSVASAAPASDSHVTVSGCPTTPGTVSIYRTTNAGTSLRAITAAAALAAATVSSYADSTADGSLGTGTFPDSSASSDTLLGRRKLLWWPIPSTALPVYGYYRRGPRTMALSADLADVPLGLVTALRVYSGIVALRERMREIPPGPLQEFARLELAAWSAVGVENPSDISPLRNIRGRRTGGHPEGRRMTITDRSTW